MNFLQKAAIEGAQLIARDTGEKWFETFLEKLENSRDPTRNLIGKVSEDAKKIAWHAGQNEESFYAEWQCFRTHEEKIQRVITSILHYLRVSYESSSIQEDVTRFFGKIVKKAPKFVLPPSNLYYITILKNFIDALTIEPVCERILVLEKLAEELAIDKRTVSDDHRVTLDIKVKLDFMDTLSDVQTNIIYYIEKLKYEQEIAPVTELFKQIEYELHDVKESLLRMMQYLHCPLRSFKAVNMAWPAIDYPYE